jgi:hypothetical protein
VTARHAAIIAICLLVPAVALLAHGVVKPLQVLGAACFLGAFLIVVALLREHHRPQPRHNCAGRQPPAVTVARPSATEADWKAVEPAPKPAVPAPSMVPYGDDTAMEAADTLLLIALLTADGEQR